MLCSQFNAVGSFDNSTNIYPTSRLRKVDRASLNEFHSVRDMIDDICLLMVSAGLAK